MNHSSRYHQTRAKLDSKESQLKAEIDVGSSRVKKLGYIIGISTVVLFVIRLAFFKKRKPVHVTAKSAKNGGFFRYQLGQVLLGIGVELLTEYWSKRRNSGPKR